MFSSFGSAEDTMQTCVNMGAPSWEASAHTMWNHPSAKNLYQYQKNGGAVWPTAVPGQDGRYYQNVSRVPQTTFSAVPQGGNYGHQLVSSRVFNDKIGQKSSMWSTGGIAQRETVPFQNPTSPSWSPSGVVYGHGVVPEHQMHWSRFYQKPPPPHPQKRITISGQSFPGVNKNQTPWQQPDTRSVFQKALPFHPRNFDQEETRCQILKRLTQTTDAETQMPERTPDRVPGTTQVRMPEKTSTRKHAQRSPYSSLHTVQGPQSPRTVCAASPEALHVAGDPFQRSKPDNGRHSQHTTPMANIPQPQNPDPLELLTTATSSPSCSALRTVANMPPVSEGRPGLFNRLLETARDPSDQSCTGQTDTCADNIAGRPASPVRNQQDHKFPQPFQPEEVESREDNQSERPISVQLQSVPTRNWTQEDLAVLVKETHQAQAKSHESSVWFDSKDIQTTFWKDPKLFLDNLRSGWYKNVMAESTDFCNEHLTLKTPVLSEAKCDLKLSGLQVLQDGEVYSEPAYSSFWRNINQQLDDIDKEFGLAGDFLHHSRFPAPLSPSSPGTAEAPSPEAKPTSPEEEQREQEKGNQKLQLAQEPEMDSAVSVPPSEDPDDVYSFVIEVLPQEQAKAIYESWNHADEAPIKGDLKGSTKPETSVDEGDSERGKDQSNSELESFCEQSKDNLSGFTFSPKQEMVQNDLDDMAKGITWEDLDFLLGADAGDESVDSYHSQDASPPREQKKDQEMENYATQDFQASEKVTRQEDQEMGNVCQKDGAELVKIIQQNDHEMTNVCQQDDRELAKIVQQNDHKMANVCHQDGDELVKIVQQNDHETANVCKQDGGELVKIVQQNDREMANVCQQDGRELAKVSQQEHEQETKKVPQKDDNQEIANVSQQNLVQKKTNVCRPVLVSPSKVSSEMWPVQGHRGHVEVIPTKRYQGERTLCIADKCLASAKKKRKRTKQSSMNIPCRKKLITKLQRKDVSKHGKETLPENHETPVELVLFGSARRKPNYTPAHHAPEVLSLSPKGTTSIKQRIYEEWCLPPTRIDGKSNYKSQRKSYADLARKQPPLPILTFGKDKCRMSLTLNKRRSRLERPKDAGALKQADDAMLRTATKCHLGKRHRVSERTPWDHQLRLVAMGTFAGTTAATWETGSN
ncbi:intraflagellar transport protein 57 homolog isoform X1 [Hippocampus comes]|uniref:intraflagellar transport protein 57 homolog isoform X1 n=1 Tax=Hippocampus comes TaxID=109280 RepID=UPI00094E0B91|nr:PREDICTED: intraflagellar transport protein 57 homolog isoform X1 [Hippocampus comes]XP_019730668.1 PREDICTED: intraflagellar transport protein 57 homolog isoform X1 [Hippocampus comes]